ncbi:hypothetical protein J4233_04190 [Candidatus Pacearchaeota archaeon]|nr:hypothetical protein [Candidatus Pacearchaeota archaeon]
MTKICQYPECDRRIVTGRKYCYEHRHTAQAEGRPPWERIEKGYVRYKLGWFWLSIYRYFYYLGIFFVIAGLLFNPLLVIAVALIVLRVIVAFRIYTIEKEIANRNQDYMEWTKKCAEVLREEREFKRSIY